MHAFLMLQETIAIATEGEFGCCDRTPMKNLPDSISFTH